MNKLPPILTCRYFPECSGCEIHGEITPPPVAKELAAFFKECAALPDFPIAISEVKGWRTRAKLAVRGTAEHPLIGLYKRGTHEVVAIEDCPLHHPAINKAIAQLIPLIRSHHILPYDELSHTGKLRYLQFFVERKSRRVQLTLVVNASSFDAMLKSLVKQLYAIGGFHSIWLNFQTDKTNVILGEKWEFCEGEPYLWERVGSVDCAFHPACFSQANPALFQTAVERIREWVIPQSHVLELFSGVGVIGLNLAHLGCEVTAVEINPYAAECFELSRLRLPPEVQGRLRMETASAEKALMHHQVLVVDPPRKGLTAPLLKAIGEAKELQQILYLSCGPQSLQSDLKVLFSQGWKVEKAEGYLFFPGTNHIETLCSLMRKERA
ncbi:MAG: hypothetical protein V4492_09120 [Chlamydiota bacterium]